MLADNEEVEGISAIQRSTVAARLEAIYQDVDNVDAFSGMIAEEHLPGTEFGELQYRLSGKNSLKIFEMAIASSTSMMQI